ncbi:glutamate-5-semialdehyde dehydrogenase [filamentous cyanobacterium CCP5]|nr:glutamate-5-semialdehyde dehydrogenase [filamentous cyanobacterium CCP5]
MSFADSQSDFPYALYQVKQASQLLANMASSRHGKALRCLANALEEQQSTILEANTLDLEASLEMAIPSQILDWLKLTPERLSASIQMLRRLASLGDPRVLSSALGRTLMPTATSYGRLVPLGVIALIYEAFPELAVIAAGLCLRTGNSLVLKGGNEASQTNLAIAQIVEQALEEAQLPIHSVLFLDAHQGDAARTSLLQAAEIDLVIPYGRPSLVHQVMRQAAIPVLPTTMGNCYLYWAASGDLDRVVEIVLESHRGEPDAVNAVEKILIHQSHSPAAITQLCRQLREKGLRLRGDADLVHDFPELTLAEDDEWSNPYLNGIVALRRVNTLETAIRLMNLHSSGHADCLVTESYRESHQFAQLVQSATVYINASSRFSRNPAQATAISLGMTARRGYGGYIGLETLMSVKYVTQGL